MAITNLGLLIYYAIPTAPYFWPWGWEDPASKCEGSECQTISLWYSNLFTDPPKPLLKPMIEAASPDLVALVEFTPDWMTQLDLGSRYPYKIELPQEGCFGVALYSKYPIVGTPVTELGGGVPREILADIEISPGRVVAVSVIHLLPPSPQSRLVNKLVTRRLSTMIRHSGKETIAVGDLNATPYSSSYKLLRYANGFSNAAWGHGLLKTWHADNPFLRFTIDHVLYRGAFRVKEFKRGEPFGSDHYTLVVKFETPKTLSKVWVSNEPELVADR